MGKASRRNKAKREGKAAVALAPQESDFTTAIQRVHSWKFGQDPNDPDAQPGSGWEYIHISGDFPTDTEDKRDKYKKAGGPESGYVCPCGEMTRIVEEATALDIFQQNFVLNGEKAEFKFTEAQKRELRDQKIVILLCPKCERITQFRADLIRHMRNQYLEKN